MSNRERPILFSAPMVRAILEGRKTQTRRIVKPQTMFDGGTWSPRVGKVTPENAAPECPYGVPGDQLWVRETFNSDWCEPLLYKADGGSALKAGYAAEPKWKPGIHMPRWASRILLEITSVRVERLRDMSAADAMAEGAVIEHEHGFCSVIDSGIDFETPQGAFAELWNSINGKDSWASNPWVWVVEFKVIERK